MEKISFPLAGIPKGSLVTCQVLSKPSRPALQATVISIDWELVQIWVYGGEDSPFHPWLQPSQNVLVDGGLAAYSVLLTALLMLHSPSRQVDKAFPTYQIDDRASRKRPPKISSPSGRLQSVERSDNRELKFWFLSSASFNGLLSIIQAQTGNNPKESISLYSIQCFQ